MALHPPKTSLICKSPCLLNLCLAVWSVCLFLLVSLLSLYEGQFQILPGSFQGFQPTCSKEKPWTLSCGFVSFPFLFQPCRRFHSLGTVDMSDWLNSLLWCTVLCIARQLSSIPALHPLDANSITFLKAWQPNVSSDTVKCFQQEEKMQN